MRWLTAKRRFVASFGGRHPVPGASDESTGVRPSATQVVPLATACQAPTANACWSRELLRVPAVALRLRIVPRGHAWQDPHADVVGSHWWRAPDVRPK